MNYAALAGKRTTQLEVPPVVPVTIDWPHDKIVDFLLEQYANNVDGTKYLLELQLWLDVQNRLNEIAKDKSDKDTSPQERSKRLDETVKEILESFTTCPYEIRRSVFEEHKNHEREFVWHFPVNILASINRQHSDGYDDDLPI